MCFKPGLLNRAALVWIKNRLSQRGAGIFCRLPCAVVFSFLGEKPAVWPRFRTFSHLLFDPAGGTLVAQSLMITALPVQCCMGDSLRIPMIFFFFFLSHQLSLSFYTSLFLSLSVALHVLIALFAFTSSWSGPRPLLFSVTASHFTSVSPSHRLFFSLLELRAVSSSRSELCSHLSHHWGRKETFFIDAASSPLGVSLFQSI